MLIILFSSYFLYMISIPLFLIILPICFGSPGLQMGTNKGFDSPWTVPSDLTPKCCLWGLAIPLQGWAGVGGGGQRARAHLHGRPAPWVGWFPERRIHRQGCRGWDVQSAHWVESGPCPLGSLGGEGNARRHRLHPLPILLFPDGPSAQLALCASHNEPPLGSPLLGGQTKLPHV